MVTRVCQAARSRSIYVMLFKIQDGGNPRWQKFKMAEIQDG